MKDFLIGDCVRMSPVLKASMRGACLPGKHVDSNLAPHSPDYGCLYCSTDHIEEFGECVGFITGFVDFNTVPEDHPDWRSNALGPEVNVRWEPSNLRYGYHPFDLELVEETMGQGARHRRRLRREKTEGPLRKIVLVNFNSGESGFADNGHRIGIGYELLECQHRHPGFHQTSKVPAKYRRCPQCRSLGVRLVEWITNLFKQKEQTK